MLGYQREKEVRILWEFSLNVTSNSVCALAWNFLSSQIFEQEIWQKKQGRPSWKRQPGVYLSLANKLVWKEPMYHTCALLCSLREGREGGKTTDILGFSMNSRNWNQHAVDYLFGSNRDVSFCLRRLRRWDLGSEQFWLL